ncbi:MAG: hypothetical protein LBE06_00730 [Azoarcus sp.]|jgi:hypothetical protein|nr:hypothetical protein [Azoarcus sp.]
MAEVPIAPPIFALRHCEGARVLATTKAARLVITPSASSLRGAKRRGNPCGGSAFRSATAACEAMWIATANVYSSRNSLIDKEYYVIPALGMDTIMDFFPFAGKPDSCSCGLPLSA